MVRGEVWWVDLGGPIGGRPAVVLTRDPIADRIGAPGVALCTTTVRGLGSEVHLGPEDGMPRPCVVSLDNVYTVRRVSFGRRICALRPDRMARVCAALRFAQAC